MGELMVAAAAREIRDREVVFVGMRLPLIAFVVAKQTHAPDAIGLFENGVVRATPPAELIYTMADPPNIFQATQCLDMIGVMSLLQAGRVDLGFLGAAEVDRYGNLNSTEVRAERGRDARATAGGTPALQKVRLPGSGGACDIASLAKRFVVLLEHARHRLPERVAYRTSPGNGDGEAAGEAWRRRVGLPRGGPAAVITTKCVLRFGRGGGAGAPENGGEAGAPENGGEAWLESVHPGATVADVVANTGWKLRVPEDVRTTVAPNAAELKAIREYDKEGFWTR
jgi:glutaconate CoA-transferase, subunit B